MIKCLTEETKVNVLGTSYKILLEKADENEEFKSGSTLGICDFYAKTIEICDLDTMKDKIADTEIQKDGLYKETVRHEILHAFLFESGLNNESHSAHGWASDEEIIDYFAIQFPKMFTIFKHLDVL